MLLRDTQFIMTTEQEDQIAKLNRFIINVQTFQEIELRQPRHNLTKEESPLLHVEGLNMPIPDCFGNGGRLNNMVASLKGSIIEATKDWIVEAKKEIIKIVNES